MFSLREDRILKCLGTKEMTFQEISDEIFTDDDRPMDDVITVMNSINRINKKCEYNKLSWKLAKYKFQGSRTTVKKKYGVKYE